MDPSAPVRTLCDAAEIAALAEPKAVIAPELAAEEVAITKTPITGEPHETLSTRPLEAPRAVAGPAPEATAPARVHDAERANEILRQVRVHLSPDLREATIQLAPAELGRISIRLSLDEGRLSAALRVERRETLEVLGRHLSELRVTLAQQGIETERFDLALGFQDQGRRGASGREERETDERASPRTIAAGSAVRGALARSIASASGVDTYA